jgi:hypothetical protein
MLIQEKISGPETLLKLYVTIDDDLSAFQPHLQRRQLPRDSRGGTPTLSAAAVRPRCTFTCSPTNAIPGKS